jgi:hypothetical protein
MAEDVQAWDFSSPKKQLFTQFEPLWRADWAVHSSKRPVVKAGSPNELSPRRPVGGELSSQGTFRPAPDRYCLPQGSPPSLVWAMLVHSCGPLEILPSLHPISILKQRPRARGPESPFRWFTQNIRSAPHPDYNQGRQIQEEDLEQEWQVVKKKWWWRHGKRSHVKSPHQLLAFGETSCSSSAWQGGTITL